jgi:hypothetical protein
MEFVPYVESSEGSWKWGVYLINTIKKSIENLIAEVEICFTVIIRV